MNRGEEKNIIKDWFDIVMPTLREAPSSENVFTQFRADPPLKLGVRVGTPCASLGGIPNPTPSGCEARSGVNPFGVRVGAAKAEASAASPFNSYFSCAFREQGAPRLDRDVPYFAIGQGRAPLNPDPSYRNRVGWAIPPSNPDPSYRNRVGGVIPPTGVPTLPFRRGYQGAAKAAPGVSLVSLTPNRAAIADGTSRGIMGSALSGEEKRRVVHKRGKGGVAKTHYKTLFCSDFVIGFPIQNRLQIPCLEKLVLHNTSKAAVVKKDGVLSPWAALSLLSGQRGKLLLSKKSVAAFKVRQGNLLGCKGDLRGDILFSFLDKFIFETLPREITTRRATATSFTHNPIPPEFMYGGVALSSHQQEQPVRKLSNPDHSYRNRVGGAIPPTGVPPLPCCGS